MNRDHKTFDSAQKKRKTEEKAKIQDCVHNYLKGEGTTHPINHCEVVCQWEGEAETGAGGGASNS